MTLHVTLPTELQDAVRQARQRAAATGELLPSPEGPATTPISAAVSKFIRQILTDGTYEQEIIRIGKEDPDLASMQVASFGPFNMPQVVDDLTLLAILSNNAGPPLLSAVESGDVQTTGTWYYRLHRAINDPMSTGTFSRMAAELSSERRSELMSALNDPPAQITIPGPRLVVPVMGALRLDPRPNLLTAEAVAVALLCGGSIRLATASPPLAQACETYGISLAMEAPIAQTSQPKSGQTPSE